MSLHLEIVSYRSDGTLIASMNGKRYKYYDVPPFQRKKMQLHIDMGDVGWAVKLLKRYSRPELHPNMKYGYGDHEKMVKEVGDDGERVC